MIQQFIAEFVGTALLILLGNGVVAGVLLKNSKSENAGWIVITVGWALAVTMSVFAVGRVSGAHLNPAVTIALAVTGSFEWTKVGIYIFAQLLGAIVGGNLVFLHYLPHWAKTDDPSVKLAVFCTAPAYRHTTANLISEIIGTFVLLFGLSAIGMENFAAGLNPLVVGALVASIGISLGGPTGYAINPARDLGPRISHFLLPIPGKRDSDWGYAWIPVVGPIIGGVLGALTYKWLFGY
jgi:glycerol uptake facilitator protein